MRTGRQSGYDGSMQNAQVVFIARSWHGIGGMQRLNQSFAVNLQRRYKAACIVIHPKGSNWFLKALWLCRSVLVSRRVVRHGGCVYLSDATMAWLARWLVRTSPGARVSMIACGLDVVYPRWWYQWMLRRSLPFVPRILCISRWTQQQALLRGAHPSSTSVVLCGVDEAPVRSSQNAAVPLLLTVGRLVPRKGVAWFVRTVLPLIVQRMPVRYVIIGNGPDLAHVRRAIVEAGMSQVVQIVQGATDEERNHWWADAAVCVVPNVMRAGDGEGFGIVCVESAMRGVPVVAARLEGLCDSVQEGVTGALFDPMNPQDCADAVCAMLTHPLPAAQVARAARSSYGWEQVFPSYIDASSC